MSEKISYNEKIELTLDKLLNDYETKSDSYKTELDEDINNLEIMLKSMKDFVEELRKARTAIKSVSDMYASIVTVNKLLLDMKEKRYKLSENDIKQLKSIQELMQKIESAKSGNTSNGSDINIVNLLNKLNG